MCFLTSWLIIPMGEPLRFTKWGIVSGLFWVPGGWAGIYGIRTCGLAVAVGTWSSTIVLTSFFWGIFVFEEHVKSKMGACLACCTLIGGLLGMSIFSRPPQTIKRKDIEKGTEEKDRITKKPVDEDDLEGIRKRIHSSQDFNDAHKNQRNHLADSTKASKRGGIMKAPIPTQDKIKDVKAAATIKKAPSSMPISLTPLEMESLIESNTNDGNEVKVPLTPNKPIIFFDRQLTLTKRQTGILASLFNGLWGGTNMVPLHFAAHDGYGGPSYVVSFATGSLLVTVALWIMRFLFEFYRHDFRIGMAYNSLPSFYIKQMWFQGCLSGILYSGGNFMCIISVTFLGQGVGYSFTQCSMLISGLWGIYCFKEIGDFKVPHLSALLAVTGILGLSYEHAS